MVAGHLFAVAGGQEDRQLGKAIAHSAGQLYPADSARHHHVGEYSVGLVAARQTIERFLGAVRDEALIAELVEEARSELGNEIVVLDDKHPPVGVLTVRLTHLCSAAPARRQVKREGRPLADLGFDSDGSAELLGKAEDLAEAEARP